MILSFLYLIFLHVFGWMAVPLAIYALIALIFKKTRIHALSILLAGSIAGGVCFIFFWLAGLIIIGIFGGKISEISISFAFLWAGTGFSLFGYPTAFFGGFLQIVLAFFKLIKNKISI